MNISDSNRRFIGIILSLFTSIICFALFAILTTNSSDELSKDYDIGTIRIVCNSVILLSLLYFSGTIVRYMMFDKTFRKTNIFFFCLLGITHFIYFIFLNFKPDNYIPNTPLSILPFITMIVYLIILLIAFINMTIRVFKNLFSCYKTEENTSLRYIVVDDSKVCGVCNEKMKDMIRLDCGHEFHEKCLHLFWSYKSSQPCPQCVP